MPRAALTAALLCALLAVSCVTSGEALRGRGPVVIGLVADLSSSGARQGNDVLKGAKLKVEVLNEAGRMGRRPLRLEALDIKDSPVEAAKAFTRLARDSRAVAVIGASFSGAGLILGSVADSLEVPLVSLSTDDRVTTPEITQGAEGSPGLLRAFAFLIRPTASQSAAAMARYALRNLPISRYAKLFDPDDPLSTIQSLSFTLAIRKGRGLVVASEELHEDQESFSPQLKKVMDAKAEAVFVCGSPEETLLVARDAKLLGVTALLIGNESWDAPFLERSGGTVTNAWFAAALSPDTDALASISARFQAEFGEKPRSAALAGWDAAGLIADAIFRAGVADPVPVAAALEQTRGYAAMLGTIDIDPKTHRAGGPPVAIMRITGGRYVMAERRFPVLP
jgi:branched-chain amino acid transport system substrate-binding protein